MENGSQNGFGLSLASPLDRYATHLAGPTKQHHLDKDELATWVRDRTDPRAKDCHVLFVLTHDSEIVGPNGRTMSQRSLITTMAIPKKLSEPDREAIIEKLCSEFYRSSEMYVAKYPDLQRFFVGAMLKDHKDEPANCEWPFLVSPPPDVAAAFYQNRADGEVSASALVGHLQRMLDRFGSLLVTNQQADKDRLLEQNKYIMDKYEQLFESRWQMALKHEELLDAKAMREVHMRKAILDMELTQKLYLDAAKYGFALLQRIVDSKYGSKEGNPMLEAFQSLEPHEVLGMIGMVNSLPDEKKQKFLPVLAIAIKSMPEDRQLKIQELMKSAWEAKQNSGEGSNNP